MSVSRTGDRLVGFEVLSAVVIKSSMSPPSSGSKNEPSKKAGGKVAVLDLTD
jgi:hypothetical protein